MLCLVDFLTAWYLVTGGMSDHFGGKLAECTQTVLEPFLAEFHCGRFRVKMPLLLFEKLKLTVSWSSSHHCSVQFKIQKSAKVITNNMNNSGGHLHSCLFHSVLGT